MCVCVVMVLDVSCHLGYLLRCLSPVWLLVIRRSKVRFPHCNCRTCSGRGLSLSLPQRHGCCCPEFIPVILTPNCRVWEHSYGCFKLSAHALQRSLFLTFNAGQTDPEHSFSYDHTKAPEKFCHRYVNISIDT